MRTRERMAPAEYKPLAQPSEDPLLAPLLAARLLDLGLKHSGAALIPSQIWEGWWWERQGGGHVDQLPGGLFKPSCHGGRWGWFQSVCE